MLITTSRYSSKKIREFAKLFSYTLSFKFIARGKKSIEKIAKIAVKNGYEKVSIVFDSKNSFAEMYFLNVDDDGWKWKKEALKIKNYKIFRNESTEIGKVEGSDKNLFISLFSFDLDFGGEGYMLANEGLLKIFNLNRKLLQLYYEVV